MFSPSQGGAATTTERRLYYYEKKSTTQVESPLDSFVSNNNNGNGNSNSSPFFPMNYQMSHHQHHHQLQPQVHRLAHDVNSSRARYVSMPQQRHYHRDEASLLRQLDQELALACSSENGDDTAAMAFKLAKKIAPTLIKDASFRTMFLRVDHDPKKAAQRMLKFFQHKLQLFGVEKLGKRITMGDLSDEDRNALFQGRMQILKEKDRAGRTVICTIVQDGETITDRSSILRVMFYLTMTALKDKDAQRQGLVSLVYAMDQKKNSNNGSKSSVFSFDTNTVLACSSLRNALPARYVSLHYCFSSDSFQSYINCDRIGFEESTQPSLFMHHAAGSRLKYELQRQGLPVASIPVSLSKNAIKRGNHEEWLDAQKYKELLEDTTGGSSDDGPFSNGADSVVQDLEPKPLRKAEPLLTDFQPQQGLGQHQNYGNMMKGGHTQQQQSFVNTANPSLAGMAQNINISNLPGMAHANGMNQSMMYANAFNQFPAAAAAMNYQLAQVQKQQQQLQQQQQQQQKEPEMSSISPTLAPMSSSKATQVAAPGSTFGVHKYDVLFGRGKVKDHYGNIYLHQLIAMKRAKYEEVERWEKTIIAEEIVAIIRDKGGRFLKPTKNPDNPWEPVEPQVAREKVAHTFRSRRSKDEQHAKAGRKQLYDVYDFR